MIHLKLLRDQPTLTGAKVRLEPMGTQHFEGLWPMFADAEGQRLTATLRRFTEEQVRAGLARARGRTDRADWAIVRVADDEVLGEAVLHQLDEDNCSMSYLVSLVGPEVFGRGYGTEATRLVRDFALGPLNLHRLSLEVLAFNKRAIAVYVTCGFVREGVRREALWRDRRWHDVIDMAIISGDPRP
ncbi:MAG: GNAT family N-acetyltransferase [Lapillicoccus sp.]